MTAGRAPLIGMTAGRATLIGKTPYTVSYQPALGGQWIRDARPIQGLDYLLARRVTNLNLAVHEISANEYHLESQPSNGKGAGSSDVCRRRH